MSFWLHTPPHSLSHGSRCVHSAEEAFVFLLFKLDCSLSWWRWEERRQNKPLSLSPDTACAWWAGLINIPTPVQSLRDSHLSNIESCPSDFHWRQPVLAFFQTVITSDSVGAGVIAQHEHRTLLSRFRHCSVTSMRSEIRRGNSWAEGSVNERRVWSKAAPAVLLQRRHIYRSISQGWPVTERSNIKCYFYRTTSSPHGCPANGKIIQFKHIFLNEYLTEINLKKGKLRIALHWFLQCHKYNGCLSFVDCVYDVLVVLVLVAWLWGMAGQSTTVCNISTTT